MRVTHDGIRLCSDCMLVACTGEYTHIDEAYGKGEAPGRGELREGAKERAAEIDAALAALGPNLVPDFDTDTGKGYDEFSWRPCHCCKSNLGGARYDFAILGD